MKKLALALVCLVSVAFFASCNPEGQPTIQVLNEEGYVQNNANLNVNTDYVFGFIMASNTATNKALSNLKVNVETFDAEGNSLATTVWADKALTGTSYTYTDTLYFELQREEIVGTAVITAIVTDAAGQTATATINVSVIQPAQMLEVNDITWVRRGSNCQNEEEMAACGLKWVARDPYHANIQPLNENCKLYVVLNNAEAFNAVTTDVEKAAYFATLMETGTPVTEYRNISTSADGEYNDILAVVDASGQQHLVLFIKAQVETGSFGTQTTITGKTK